MCFLCDSKLRITASNFVEISSIYLVLSHKFLLVFLALVTYNPKLKKFQVIKT